MRMVGLRPNFASCQYRNELVIRGAREKFRSAAFGENVQNNILVRGILAVAVTFPIARFRIELDTAANRLGPIERNRNLGEIGARFPIPDTKLYDAHRAS